MIQINQNEVGVIAFADESSIFDPIKLSRIMAHQLHYLF